MLEQSKLVFWLIKDGKLYIGIKSKKPSEYFMHSGFLVSFKLTLYH